MAQETKMVEIIRDEKGRFVKGMPSLNKGIPLSEETKKKLSESHKGKIASEETRKKMSLARKGKPQKPFTKEHLKNMSLARIGKKLPFETRQKMSLSKRGVGNSFYGKHHSEETRRKLSEDHMGKIPWNKGKDFLKLEKNPRWLGGKSFEPYTLEFTKKFKKMIRQRDGCCMMCNIGLFDLYLLKRKIDIHHIDYNKLNSFPQNCVTLCVACHMRTNGNRSHWTKFFQSLLKERYGYEYTEDQKIIFDFIRKEEAKW